MHSDGAAYGKINILKRRRRPQRFGRVDAVAASTLLPCHPSLPASFKRRGQRALTSYGYAY